MQKTSIKNVSIGDLEAAIAKTIEELTGKPWSVRIGAVTYPPAAIGATAVDRSAENVTLELSAAVTVELPPFLSDFTR